MNTNDPTVVPESTRDLLKKFVDFANNSFVPALSAFYSGGKAHVGTVSIMPDDMMPKNVGAFYISAKPDGAMLRKLLGGEATPITAMYVTMQTAIIVAAVLEGRTQQLPMDQRTAILRQFKTQLKFVVHEVTHAVGDKDLNAFEQESENTHRRQLTAWKEAVTELSTQTFMDDILKQSGLAASDPMLLQVEPYDTGSYVGVVDAAQALIQGLSAMIPGSTPDAELKALVESGCGQKALTALVTKAFTARGMNNQLAVAGLVRKIGSSFEQLEESYMKTLTDLNSTRSRTAVEVAMADLHQRGTALGTHLVDEIEAMLTTTPLPRVPDSFGQPDFRGAGRFISLTGERDGGYPRRIPLGPAHIAAALTLE